MHDDNFDKIMRQFKTKPLGSSERVRFNEGLDLKIEKYQRRAFSFYRMSYGFGTAMIAMIAISVMSIWSSYRQIEPELQSISVLSYSADYYDDSYFDYSSDDTLTEAYVGLLVSDYVEEYGAATSDVLLGDLSDEELEYLEHNFDMGDIL